MIAPIPVRVLRHKCPHCRRSYAHRGSAISHMGRCWRNPEMRGCKTCRHFEQDPGEPEVGLMGGEGCAVGVSLDGRPACPACGGHGLADASSGAQVECGPQFTSAHVGDGHEVKPGPIIRCDRWEAAK